MTSSLPHPVPSHVLGSPNFSCGTACWTSAPSQRGCTVRSSPVAGINYHGPPPRILLLHPRSYYFPRPQQCFVQLVTKFIDACLTTSCSCADTPASKPLPLPILPCSSCLYLGPSWKRLLLFWPHWLSFPELACAWVLSLLAG